MKKISLLTASLALVLSGCSDSDGSNTPLPDDGILGSTDSVTVKVIDGYLVNAEVYVDRNENGLPEASEKLSALTDVNGEIVLDQSDAVYPLIVRAIAGKTYDQDKAGRLTETYELTAKAGSETVTPFSTAAKAQSMTVSELAASLNLPESVVSGDYVADSSDDAITTHLYARSLAQYLSSDSSTLEATSMEAALTEINDAVATISESEKAGKYVDNTGTVQDMPPSLEEFLVGSTFSMVSTNSYWFADDGGALSVSFAADTLSFDGETVSVTYGNNGYVAAEFDVNEEVAYRGDDLALVFTNENDLNLYSKTTDFASGFTAMTATAEMFSGKTFYYVADNSTTETPTPVYTTFVFNADDTLTIQQDNAEYTAYWSIDNDKLWLESMPEGSDWYISPVFDENSMIVGYEGSDSKTIPVFFIKNKDMADSLYKQWNTRL